MTDARCEPPEGLRTKLGWHWVSIYGRERCAYWWERPDRKWGWWNSSGEDGWRYLSPVATPAEVAALRAENARLREALEWSHSAFVAQRGTVPARNRLMHLTIKNCRMAVADILAQARAALTPTEAPDERT